MLKESQKQRDQRISYQQAMGMRTDRNMVDEEVCPECNQDPCVCEEKELTELRGGM